VLVAAEAVDEHDRLRVGSSLDPDVELIDSCHALQGIRGSPRRAHPEECLIRSGEDRARVARAGVVTS